MHRNEQLQTAILAHDDPKYDRNAPQNTNRQHAQTRTNTIDRPDRSIDRIAGRRGAVSRDHAVGADRPRLDEESIT